MSEPTRISIRAQRDLGEIIRDAYRLYVANFPAFFLIALVVAPWEMLSTVIVRGIDDTAQAQAATYYVTIPGLIIGLIASGGIMRMVSDLADGAPASAGDALDTGLQRFWPSLVAGFIAALHMLASVFAAPFLALYWLINRKATIDGRRDWFFALIPLVLTFYLFVRWTFIQYAVVLQDKRGWQAIDESADLVRERWWRVFAILLVTGLLQLVPSLIIAQFSALAAPLADGAIVALTSVILLPFAIVTQTLLYYDLKARNADDTLHAAAAIDAAESDLPGESPRDV